MGLWETMVMGDYDQDIMGDYEYGIMGEYEYEIMGLWVRMSMRYGSSTFGDTSIGSKGPEVTMGSESKPDTGHDE